jgi:hypothetical protein
MRKCIIIVFFLSLSLLAQQIYAQSVTQGTTQNNSDAVPINGGGGGIPEIQEKVYYTVLPEKPNAGDLVDISAEMYGTPIKDAVFVWNVNGKLFKSGQGVNKISVYIDKGTKVSVSIITIKGNKLAKEWSFNPENVVIMWEAGTYTPPFYKGKSLYTPESTLTLHGINLDAKNPLTSTYANYVWKMDGSVQGNDSGVSRRTFTYTGDILQEEPYFELLYSSVTNYKDAITIRSAPVNTRSVLQVQTLDTNIFTYEKTPLLGVLFNKKLDTTFMFDKKETTLVSYPIYYSVFSSLVPKYTWSLNDSVIKTNSNFLSFKKTKDDERSRLDIQISNPLSLLQKHDVVHIIDTTTKNPTIDSSPVVGGFGK